MCCTAIPFTRRYSATSRRWQRQNTLSEHMKAVGLSPATANNSLTPSRNSSVSVANGSGSMAGAYATQASTNSSYNFNTTASTDSSGNWSESGAGHQWWDGGNHMTYVGSGTYDESGTGGSFGTWSGAGDLHESGSTDSSYKYDAGYQVTGAATGGGWAWTGPGSTGAGNASGSGASYWSKSGTGVYGTVR